MRKKFYAKSAAMLALVSMLGSIVAGCGNDTTDEKNNVTTIADATETTSDEKTTVNEEETTVVEEETTADVYGIPTPDKSLINSIIPGKVTVEGTDFKVGEETIFFNGANVPWNNWNDFGGSFNEGFWRSHFAKLHENGINAARVWITCNGTIGILMDDDGHVNGATPLHWKSLDALFKQAEENGIYIMATLISFDHFKEENGKSDAWRTMVQDNDLIDSYINNYLIPFCQRYDDYDSLFSIDLCNEPDWIIENKECGKLKWSVVANYFAREAAAIHENSDILVTVGTAMPKYNSDRHSGNYISDEKLKGYCENENAYLDYYCPHFYEWEATWYGFPFDKSPVDFGMDSTKPCILGEFPASGMTDKTGGSKNMTGAECYVGLYNNNWNGAFAWTSNGVDSCGRLEDFVDGVKENFNNGLTK